MQERGLKGVKNPKTPLGEPATGPSRSLRLRHSFRKSVSIYPRSAPGPERIIYSMTQPAFFLYRLLDNPRLKLQATGNFTRFIHVRADLQNIKNT